MKKRIQLRGASLCLAVLLSACTATGSRGTAQNTYSTADGAELEETLGDPSLARDLVMESIHTERRDDRLYVQLNLRNTRASNLPIEWTIVWLDSGGFRIDSPRDWTPMTLGGKGFETISRTAPTPAASGFKLGLRRPNTVR